MKISDKDLLIKVAKLVNQERQTHSLLLEHLQEVQRRRLYAELGHSSMFKYLTRELKYSEGAAVRRVNTLRLTSKIPEVKKMIQKGDLSLAVASRAQHFCKNLSNSKTKKVVNQLKGKGIDEAKRVLLDLSQSDIPAMPPREIKRPLSKSETRVYLNISNKTLKKFEKYQAITKFNTDQALSTLLKRAFDEIETNLNSYKNSKGTTGRGIPVWIKKQVLKRADFVCEFENCDEIRNLEFEHIVPYAKGGQHSLENIKLFCKAHNQRSAIKEFGQLKMDRFIN